MPRFIFRAHLWRWLGIECVFHSSRVSTLFLGPERRDISRALAMCSDAINFLPTRVELPRH